MKAKANLALVDVFMGEKPNIGKPDAKAPKMKTTETHCVRIYIAGDVSTIRRACRVFCLRGLCVTITPTEYVYTGGMESGAVVGLINYPRFPNAPESINEMALDLARCLMAECCQRSCTVETPDQTHFIENEGIAIPR